MNSEESPEFSGTSHLQDFNIGASGSRCSCRTECTKERESAPYTSEDPLEDNDIEIQQEEKHGSVGEIYSNDDWLVQTRCAFDNKNRHNKNIVIWKDGYLVPLSHASIDLDDEISKCFEDSVRICPDSSFDYSDPELGNEACPEIFDVDDSPEQFNDSLASSEEKIRRPPAERNKLHIKFPDDSDSKLMSDVKCQGTEFECSYVNLFDPESEGFGTSERHTYQTPEAEREEAGASERSSYSTDSHGDGESYEIVNWNEEWSQNDDDPRTGSETHDCFDTPPTSFDGDHSDSNDFHTADNSPVPNTESFCVLDVPRYSCGSEGAGANFLSPDYIDSTSEQLGSIRDPRDGEAACVGGQSNNAICSGSSYTIAIETWDVPDSYKINYIRDKAVYSKVNQTTRRYSLSNRRRASHAPKPVPFIDAHAIEYEADPKTGKARSVGKGSFGEVFKARFFDPRFHHLAIVVKEFDEEFTSRHEIIEEAQKLLYLQDTGFVPVCYGVINLGCDSSPRYGIVQNYVGTGLTLEQLLWEQYDMPLEMWLSIALQCCEGLDLFHRKGILMNDIKSNNVIPEFFQDVVSIKYIDFGLATGMTGKRYKDTKSLEEFVYLAPEVRIDGKMTSVASDVYSLGYMLDQISGSAWSPELRLVAGTCMKIEPSERSTVSHAANFIRNHMNRLGCDTSNYRQVRGQRFL